MFVNGLGQCTLGAVVFAGLGDLGRPEGFLERAVNGEVLSDRDLSVLARDSEPLLQRMNKAVALYTTGTRHHADCLLPRRR